MQKETLEKIEIMSKIFRNITLTIIVPLFLYGTFFEVQDYLKERKIFLEKRLDKEKTHTQTILKKWDKFFQSQKKSAKDKFELMTENFMKKILESLSK
jgi:hypothetical protein